MSTVGVEIVSDAVKRISMVIETDRLSLEQLQALEKIFFKAYMGTLATLDKANLNLDHVSKLRCPFCAKAPETAPDYPHIEGDAWGAVRCANPQCPTYDSLLGHGVCVRDGENEADNRGTDEYIKSAIVRWNIRKYGSDYLDQSA